MTPTEKQQLLLLVFELLKQHPNAFKEVIDAAVSGVNEFANNQNDIAARLSFMLSARMDGKKTFTREQEFEALRPVLGGTAWYNKKTKKQ